MRLEVLTDPEKPSNSLTTVVGKGSEPGRWPRRENPPHVQMERGSRHFIGVVQKVPDESQCINATLPAPLAMKMGGTFAPRDGVYDNFADAICYLSFFA